MYLDQIVSAISDNLNVPENKYDFYYKAEDGHLYQDNVKLEQKRKELIRDVIAMQNQFVEIDDIAQLDSFKLLIETYNEYHRERCLRGGDPMEFARRDLSDIRIMVAKLISTGRIEVKKPMSVLEAEINE